MHENRRRHEQAFKTCILQVFLNAARYGLLKGMQDRCILSAISKVKRYIRLKGMQDRCILSAVSEEERYSSLKEMLLSPPPL